MMRTYFQEQLDQLKVELIRMGALCEQAISDAAKACLENDEQLGVRAVELEREIDQEQQDIQQRCMKLLLRQQPVAGDLRVVSAAMYMISDMERIGDQAADIAELSTHLSGSDDMDKTLLGDMARAAIGMVTDSVDAFVRGDLDLAHQVIVRDDVVDELFCRVRGELTAMIASGAGADQCLDLLMIAKYFERIGDHATNIAEWVEYGLTGHYEED